MKNKRILCAAAAAAVTVAVCGCSVRIGTNNVREVEDDYVVAKPSVDTVIDIGADTDGETVSIDANALGITYLDFKKEYLYYLKAMGIADDTDESVADSCKEQRATIINYLINEQIIYDKARQLGVSTLTAEEMDSVETEYEELISEQIDYFAGIADYSDLGTAEVSDDEKELRGGEAFDEYLADCGLTRDDLLMWQVSSAVTNKVYAEVTKDTTVEYSEAQQTFDDYVASIQALYEDNVYEYESGAYSVYWIPDGSRRIKHILLSFDESFTDELTDMRDNGDDDGADELRAEKAAELEQTADDIIGMIEGGSDFDELITEYSADASGSSLYPDGYLVVPDSEYYMQEFTDAALSLENVGDYCTAVTDYGVHIILYASDAAVTDEDVESYVQYIYETLDTNAKTAYFNELLDQWKEEYSYEIDYEALRLDDPDSE